MQTVCNEYATHNKHLIEEIKEKNKLLARYRQALEEILTTDNYGFSYKEAKEILNEVNAGDILNYILIAHSKGVSDGNPIYNYSGDY